MLIVERFMYRIRLVVLVCVEGRLIGYGFGFFWVRVVVVVLVMVVMGVRKGVGICVLEGCGVGRYCKGKG